MNIEVLLTEAEIANEFAESLEARDLPEKFFYWSPLSVRAWKDFAANTYESLQQTWDAIASRVEDLTKSFRGYVPVISFGAGDGSKDMGILRALRDAGRALKYFPVDASQTMLEIACAAAEDEECEAMGIKADISSPVHLLLAADAAEAPRLFLMVGNTLGGFDPFEQLRHLAECVHQGDLLILDTRIHSSEPEELSDGQKCFILAPLASLGVRPEDGELKLVENRDDRRSGIYLMTRRFHVGRDLTIFVSGREVHIERGERIFLNFRYSFTPEAFRWLITTHARLKLMAEIPSADGKFITVICGKQ